MDIGICIGGNCGEGAEFMFDADGMLIGDSPMNLRIY
jgi:hypothetical protein